MKRISKPIVLILAMLMVVLLQSCTKEEFYCELEYDGYTFKDNDYSLEDSDDYFSYDEEEENPDCPYKFVAFISKPEGNTGTVEMKEYWTDDRKAHISKVRFSKWTNDRLTIEMTGVIYVDMHNSSGEVTNDSCIVLGIYFDDVSTKGIIGNEYHYLQGFVADPADLPAFFESNKEFIEEYEKVLEPLIQHANDVFYPTLQNFKPTKVYYPVEITLKEKIGTAWFNTLIISCSVIGVGIIIAVTIFLFVYLPDSRKTNEGPNLQVSDLAQMKKKKKE